MFDSIDAEIANERYGLSNIFPCRAVIRGTTLSTTGVALVKSCAQRSLTILNSQNDKYRLLSVHEKLFPYGYGLKYLGTLAVKSVY
jgi:hypothetical protein